MNKSIIRIGGASGYWGDAALSTPQLLADAKQTGKKLDYLVYDYLAEITMSIMARARAADALVRLMRPKAMPQTLFILHLNQTLLRSPSRV